MFDWIKGKVKGAGALLGKWKNTVVKSTGALADKAQDVAAGVADYVTGAVDVLKGKDPDKPAAAGFPVGLVAAAGAAWFMMRGRRRLLGGLFR